MIDHAPPAPRRHSTARATRRTWLTSAGLLMCTGLPVHALDTPRGKVVLTVVGRGLRVNAGDRADFDMAMLEALPQHEFITQTPWFKGARRFSGPLLRDVLAAAGATGRSLQAVALNNYKVDIPLDDALRFKLLLATRMDGQPMTVRNKGPLFIVYPFDESADLRSERYYSRSAWQLRTIEVR
jgi:hypothetical protein